VSLDLVESSACLVLAAAVLVLLLAAAAHSSLCSLLLPLLELERCCCTVQSEYQYCSHKVVRRKECKHQSTAQPQHRAPNSTLCRHNKLKCPTPREQQSPPPSLAPRGPATNPSAPSPGAEAQGRQTSVKSLVLGTRQPQAPAPSDSAPELVT
jgi:hypothetical protein